MRDLNRSQDPGARKAKLEMRNEPVGSRQDRIQGNRKNVISRRSDEANSDIPGKLCAPEGQYICRNEDIPVFSTLCRGGT